MSRILLLVLGGASIPLPARADLTSVDLSTYVRVGRYALPEPLRTALPNGTPLHNLLCQEASGVAYNWDTDTLFIVGDGGKSVTQVSKTGELIDTMTLPLGDSVQGTDFFDTEGITYIGGGEFVMSEERDRQLVKFTYAAGTTLTRELAKTVKLGTFVNNIGIEGVSWDPQSGGFICIKELSPLGIFQTGVDFEAGTATNGSETTEDSVNLFDPALAGMIDFADVFALSNLPSMTGQAQEGNLLLLGQEEGRVVNIDRSGTVLSTLNITSDAGNPLSVGGQQHEGLTMDRAGNLYIVSENGGGDIDHPQLWVYAPAVVENQAPTAVVLDNAVHTLVENTETSAPVKVADIVVTDDGLGINQLSLTGADAASFEIAGNALYIKAGTVIDFETKSTYGVTVNADDITVGGTPDATADFVLNVSDVADETPPTPHVFLSEIHPTGSSSTYAADWFELTNSGSTAVDISGWMVDDNSNGSGKLALRGVTSIPAGESAVFFEGVADGSTDATVIAGFSTAWFGTATPPAGLLIGSYGGASIGLGSGGDSVNIFDAAGNRVTGVSFGAATLGITYENQTGIGSETLPLPILSTMSVAGKHGAFLSADGLQTGSPGITGKVIISEVAPWSSSSPVGADWFEVTNTRATPLRVTGWKTDDNTQSFIGAAALNGIDIIAPGESVVFIETTDLPGKAALFRSTWFGANPPAGLQIGSYSGSGGLGSGGDQVNLYDGVGRLRAAVSFGASPTGPFATFDNAAGLNDSPISQLSAIGVHGGFVAKSEPDAIGSPGNISNGDAPAGTFGAWLFSKGYASAGIDADSDGDGLSDRVEYFFNRNPNKVEGGDHLPRLVANDGVMELGFTRNSDSGDVRGEIEVSGDMESWNSGVEGIDYTVAESQVTGDETTINCLLPGSGPSAAGVSATYLTPNPSDPAGVSLGGVRVVNEGLVGVGRLSGESLDKFGETQGASSGLFITNWGYGSGHFTGTLNVLPDRGHGDGSSNYAARLHKVDFTFAPYYGAGPVGQNQVSMTYMDSSKFTYQDGAREKFTTGLNPTGTSTLFDQTVGTVTAANGPGGAQENLLSIDAEAVQLFPDGSGYFSDEYGTYIARFDAAKRITGLTQLPGAAQPFKSGSPSFDSVAAPTTGRRNNQGLEGMSVTPDGSRLFAMLQSATVQDTNGANQQTRNNARLFVYDIVGEKREHPALIGEYVVKLPQIDLNSDGSGADGTAAQSEIVALGNSSFLMLPRDGNGLGKGTLTPILFKSVQLVDFASATNIVGQYDGVGEQISPGGALRQEVLAAATAEVINLLQPDDLAKFGLNTSMPADANTMNEKIEGMALVADLSTPAANDFFLFVGNDNDFESSDVRMLNGEGNVVSKGDGRLNAGITNDAMIYVWRLTIDTGGKKFFRFSVK